MPEGLDDIQLMARVRDEDTDALREIIQRYQQPLVNFFSRLGADIDRAEDCTQETFIKLYNYRHKYRPTSKFTTFLYTLARHSWADACRREKHLKFSHTGTGDTATKAVLPDNRLDIEMALGKLSNKLRETVVLSVYQGLNYEEISKVLNIPVGTVKSRMSLAFQTLREVLGDE